jgi:transketolase
MPDLDSRSKYLRRLAIRCLRGGQRGHIGSTFSLTEIMRVLYDDVAQHNPEDPAWEGRDRIILSKGHGCVAQYAMLADKGYISMTALDTFCRKDGILGGHPSHKVPGIECDTGALGHGLSMGIGMALAAKIRKQDYRVFVVMGDGEIQEGSVWEAAMCAAKHKLDNLTVIIDYNKIQSSGFVKDICPLEPLADKWDAFGFGIWECDGHSLSDLKAALDDAARYDEKPTCIIAHTVKGKGISFAENQPLWHHKAHITEEQFQALEAEVA